MRGGSEVPTYHFYGKEGGRVVEKIVERGRQSGKEGLPCVYVVLV